MHDHRSHRDTKYGDCQSPRAARSAGACMQVSCKEKKSNNLNAEQAETSSTVQCAEMKE